MTENRYAMTDRGRQRPDQKTPFYRRIDALADIIGSAADRQDARG